MLRKSQRYFSYFVISCCCIEIREEKAFRRVTIFLLLRTIYCYSARQYIPYQLQYKTSLLFFLKGFWEGLLIEFSLGNFSLHFFQDILGKLTAYGLLLEKVFYYRNLTFRDDLLFEFSRGVYYWRGAFYWSEYVCSIKKFISYIRCSLDLIGQRGYDSLKNVLRA